MSYTFGVEVAERVRQHIHEHSFVPSDSSDNSMIPSSSQTELQPFDFEELPAEIRCNIYSQLFDNAELATIQKHPLFLVSRAMREEVTYTLLATRPVVITVDSNNECHPMIPKAIYHFLKSAGPCFTDVKLRYTFGPVGYYGDIAHIFRVSEKFEHRSLRAARCSAWAEVEQLLEEMHKKGNGKLGVLDVVKLAQILCEGG